MQHDWTPSTLGHGNQMCRRCWITNLEAAAIGMIECDAPPPKAANQNAPADLIEDEEDHAGDDELEADMNCGKYPGSQGCSLAGTEWCDWSCPYGG